MAEPGSVVQYQDYAESPFPPPTNVSGAAAPSATIVLPGIWLDYQAYAAPVLAPTDVAPSVPDGVAAYLTVYPDPMQFQRLPALGSTAVFLLPFQVSGGALSWVPVYSGQPGLQAFLQQTFVLSPPVITTPTVPDFSWVPSYPDRVGERQPGLHASMVPNLTEGFVPITPAALPPALSWAPVFPDLVASQIDVGRFTQPGERVSAVTQVIPVVHAANAFILDHSTLGGGQYRTIPFDLEGEFRQVQFRWRQSGVSQDMEPHYLEFHFTIVGVSEEP